MVDSKKIKKLLEEGIIWPPELRTGVTYSRVQDDHDGEYKGRIIMSFSPDGDAWVDIDTSRVSLRFRSAFGGSMSPRVYTALTILALAMKLDSDERPDPVSTENSEK